MEEVSDLMQQESPPISIIHEQDAPHRRRKSNACRSLGASGDVDVDGIAPPQVRAGVVPRLNVQIN